MYRQETTKLHKISHSSAFRMVVTHHAEEQMADRKVTRFEVERVLKAAPVVMVETDPDGSERWRVAGRDADGRRIEVVVEVSPPSTAVLVTVIRVG